MMVAVSRYSTVIACDSPDCPSRFATGSWRSLARGQARDLGWLRVPPWALAVEDSPRRRLDACPAHAVAAQEAIRSRDEQRALARAEKIRRREERWKKAREKQEAKEAEAAVAAVGSKAAAAPVGFASADVPSPITEARANSEVVFQRPRRTSGIPSNLDVVEQILRERGTPMTVGEIVEAAIGVHALPTHSRTPRTVIARDLAIDVRDRVDSRFIRVSPGVFALRSCPDTPRTHEPELGARP